MRRCMTNVSSRTITQHSEATIFLLLPVWGTGSLSLLLTPDKFTKTGLTQSGSRSPGGRLKNTTGNLIPQPRDRNVGAEMMT
mmetsp:Transcript_5322/g.9815  ORF Transcript_5322/g.9815 Transcript_5322/m.9815 type:complete len:82 (+) Transcript_5322:443-688(+)